MEFNSYNCFHSALYDILSPHYKNNTNFLINNRWQFFYSPKTQYTDDLRIVGEWPMLFDKYYLNLLSDLTGIKVAIVKEEKSTFEDFLSICNAVPSVFFVNKVNLHSKSISVKRNCVTTIIIEDIKDNFFVCRTYDKDLYALQNIEKSVLYFDWLNASDYSQINGSKIQIEIPKSIKKEAALELCQSCIKNSLKQHLNSSKCKNVFVGIDAINRFSEDIVKWKSLGAQRLIDSSMYLDSAIVQREKFIICLNDFLHVSCTEMLDKLREICDNWKKLKMILFIIGKREQFDSLIFVQELMRKVAHDEYYILKKVLDII